jgi:hypothetical protein
MKIKVERIENNERIIEVGEVYIENNNFGVRCIVHNIQTEEKIGKESIYTKIKEAIRKRKSWIEIKELQERKNMTKEEVK